MLLIDHHQVLFIAVGIYFLALGLILFNAVRTKHPRRSNVTALRSYGIGPDYHLYLLEGRKEEYAEIHRKDFPERIKSVAMCKFDGKIYTVFRPIDHVQLRQYVNDLGIGPIDSYGWITSHGRYIPTYEAWEVAVTANQIPAVQPGDNALLAALLWSDQRLPKAA